MMPTQGIKAVVSDASEAMVVGSNLEPVNVQKASLIIIIQISWIGFHLELAKHLK